MYTSPTIVDHFSSEDTVSPTQHTAYGLLFLLDTTFLLEYLSSTDGHLTFRRSSLLGVFDLVRRMLFDMGLAGEVLWGIRT